MLAATVPLVLAVVLVVGLAGGSGLLSPALRVGDRAPDFAPTVDIHRKPGYDPAELFLRTDGLGTKLRIASRLVQKALGFRYLMDVIPLDAALVKGSHGRLTDDPAAGPVFVSSEPGLLPAGAVEATDVKRLVLDHVFEP